MAERLIDEIWRKNSRDYRGRIESAIREANRHGCVIHSRGEVESAARRLAVREESRRLVGLRKNDG